MTQQICMQFPAAVDCTACMSPVAQAKASCLAAQILRVVVVVVAGDVAPQLLQRWHVWCTTPARTFALGFAHGPCNTAHLAAAVALCCTMARDSSPLATAIIVSSGLLLSQAATACQIA